MSTPYFPDHSDERIIGTPRVLGYDTLKWYSADDCFPQNDDQQLLITQKKDGRRGVNIGYYDKQSNSWHGSGSMSHVIAWTFLPDTEKVMVDL